MSTSETAGGWRGLGAAAGELALAVLTAAVVSLGLQFVIGRLPIPPRSNVGSAVIMVGAGATLLVLFAVLAGRWRPRLSLVTTWVALPATVTITLAASLSGTRYYFGGATNDQSFRLEYLTRLASSAKLADFAYADLPPYYPAGWFWLAGRFANLTGMPGWAAFKPFAILTIAVAAAVCFWLWSRSVPRRTALLLATLGTVFGLTLGSTDSTVAVTEPYSWLAVLTIPPLLVLAWRAMEAQREPSPPFAGYRMVVAVGLLAGVYGATYTLYFAFTVLVLVLLAGGVLVRHRWIRRRGVDTAAPTKTLLARTARLGAVAAVGALVVMLPVWTPYLLGVLEGGQDNNVASHFLPSVGASFPMPFLQLSLTGVLCLVGLVWLVLALLGGSRYRAVACALAITVAGTYLWYLLSVLALAMGTTLLAFRIEPILVVSLITASGLAGLEGLRLAREHVGLRWQQAALVLPALLGLVVVLAQLQGFPRHNAKVIGDAFHNYYPTGRSALGTSNSRDSDYWTPRLAEAIDSLHQQRPIVAGSDPKLLFAAHTYWRFQATTPHYANPLANYEQRNSLLRDWASTKDSSELHRKLADSPVAPPTVFLLRQSESDRDVLTNRIATDIFPQNPNVAFGTLSFDRAQFDDPAFTVRDVGPFTVVGVRY